MDLAQLGLLLIAILLVALIFYISGGIVGQEWAVSGSYFLRILIVAVVAVVVVPLFRDIPGGFDIGDIGLLIGFVVLIIVVRYVLVEELAVSDEWLASIVLSLIAVVLIYIVDELAREYFEVNLLSVL